MSILDWLYFLYSKSLEHLLDPSLYCSLCSNHDETSLLSDWIDIGGLLTFRRAVLVSLSLILASYLLWIGGSNCCIIDGMDVLCNRFRLLSRNLIPSITLSYLLKSVSDDSVSVSLRFCCSRLKLSHFSYLLVFDPGHLFPTKTWVWGAQLSVWSYGSELSVRQGWKWHRSWVLGRVWACL